MKEFFTGFIVVIVAVCVSGCGPSVDRGLIPPIVIEQEVQDDYGFSIDVPPDATVTAAGYVTACPEGWTGECPEHYAFSFRGHDGSLLYDFRVSIDQPDTGNLPDVAEAGQVLDDGAVVVSPTFIDGLPEEGPNEWSTGAARVRSPDHVFLFQLDIKTIDPEQVDATFSRLIGGFRLTEDD